jgi:DNA (cytosine-5)-methyltransferase 1
MDAAPVWSDCKTFPCEPFVDRVGLFVASYPCQGESCAGKGLGKADPRWLWPYCRRFIHAVRPRAVFLENVDGHVGRGLRSVLADLVALGYRLEGASGEPTWGLFSAEECGAPHRRRRVFIYGELADAKREPGSAEQRPEPGRWKATGPQHVAVPGETCEGLADSDVRECRGQRIARECEIRETASRGCEELGDAAGDDERRSSVAAMHGEGEQAGGSGGRVANADGEKRHGNQRDEDPSGCSGSTDEGYELARLGVGQADSEHTGCGEQRGAVPVPSEHAPFECRLPPYPPRPGDAAGWARVLAVRPDLAPALSDEEEAELQVRELAHGHSSRVDQLRMAGNGVVPDTAERAFRTLHGRMHAK